MHSNDAKQWNGPFVPQTCSWLVRFLCRSFDVVYSLSAMVLLGRYVEAAWNNTHGAAGAKVDVTAKVLGGCSPPVRESRACPCLPRACLSRSSDKTAKLNVDIETAFRSSLDMLSVQAQLLRNSPLTESVFLVPREKELLQRYFGSELHRAISRVLAKMAMHEDAADGILSIAAFFLFSPRVRVRLSFRSHDCQ